MPQYRSERNYENLTKYQFPGVGRYDVPALQPLAPLKPDDVPNWIGFNYVKGCDEPALHGVHFFVDDYQFNRLWAQPDRYLTRLVEFAAVMTPDFSTYSDFPMALQIYNHYRKHWLGAYWQLLGMNVVPTISWSDEASYEWCFDGEPVGGVVAVSAVGTQMDEVSRALFMDGYAEMLRRLRPTQIIFYGRVPEGCEGNIVQIKSFQDVLKEKRTEQNKT